MKILTGYIAKECFLYTSISLVIFTTLLLVGRLLQLSDLMISKGVAPSQILWVLASLIPTFLEISLPIAILIGVCTTFARMSGDSEIIVLRASGLNLKKLLPGVLLMASIAFFLHLLITLELRPWGYRNLSNTLFNIAKSKSTAGLSPALFNKLGKLTIYPEVLDATSGAMERILIEDRRDKETTQIITATSGQIKSDETSHTIVIQLFDGSISESSGQTYSVTRFDQTILKLSTDEIFASDQKLSNKGGRELSTLTLINYIKKRASLLEKKTKKQTSLKGRKELEKEIRSLTFELDSRATMPIVSFIFAVLALALGIIPPRAQKSWGQTLSILLGLIVFLLYFASHTLAASINEAGGLPSFICALIPSTIFTIFTYFIFTKISSEQWASIASAFEFLLNAIKNVFLKLFKSKEKNL